MSEPVKPAASTDSPREDAEQERGRADEHGVSVEAARNEAEHARQVAEVEVVEEMRRALRDIRDVHKLDSN